MNLKNHSSFLLLLVAISVVHYLTLDSHGMFMWDEAEYANLARAISEGKAYTNALRPPMMAISGAIFLFVFGSDSDLTLKLSVWIFSLLNVSLIYYIISDLKDRYLALLTAAIFGLLPAFWQHTSFFLAEIPFLFFFTGAVLFFYKGLYHSVRNFYPAWIMTGGAFLTRYTALLLGPIMMLFILIALITNRQEILQKLRNRHFWISPFTALLILIPWFAHQQMEHGDFLIGFKIASKQLPIYMPSVEMPWDFYLSGLPHMLGIPSLSIGIIGVGWSLYKKDRLGMHAALVIAFLMIWFSQYRYKEFRLITSFLPFWAILGSIGFIEVGSIIWKRTRSNIFIFIISIVLGLSSYIRSKAFFDQSVALGYPAFIDGMNYLRKNALPNEKVMGASAPQIEWYSSLEAITFPQDIDGLKKNLANCDWLVFVNFERGQPEYIHPLFSTKIEQGHIDSGYVGVFKSANGVFTVVGRSSYFQQLMQSE